MASKLSTTYEENAGDLREGPQQNLATQGRTAEHPLLETANHQMVIPEFVIDSIARCLLPQAQAYFATAEGQAAFEEWKKNKNG